MTLVKSGLSDDVIVNHVRANGVASQLTPNDIIQMHENGVSEKVINAMQQTASSQLAGPAVPYGQPVIIEESYVVPPLLAPATVLVRPWSLPPPLPPARCSVGIFLLPLNCGMSRHRSCIFAWVTCFSVSPISSLLSSSLISVLSFSLALLANAVTIGLVAAGSFSTSCASSVSDLSLSCSLATAALAVSLSLIAFQHSPVKLS